MASCIHLLCRPCGSLFLVAFLLLLELGYGATTSGNAASESLSSAIMDANSTGFDLGTLGNLFAAQIYHAQLTDTFPTNPLLTTSPLSPERYKLDAFPKGEIQQRMYYGNASNGLPPNVQGIWLTSGLGLPSDAISSAGTYDPIRRKLTISPTAIRAWAFTGTSSVKDGLLWAPSGSMDFNFNLAAGTYFDIYFNEEATFGQILFGIRILGIPILLPPVLVDFTMAWLGNDTWQRESSVFTIPVPVTGRYLLKRAVNGDGSKGPYFDEYLAYNEGLPSAVPIPA